MATRKTSLKDKEKTADLPPKGDRNPDPITNSPGSHPIETGVGAAVGGAASGLAVGAVGGPIGAAVGAMVGGAIAGGLAGKGIGELIDPTTEDNWLRDYFNAETDHGGRTAEDYRPAYRYGIGLRDRYQGRGWEEIEPEARTGWDEYEHHSGDDWTDVNRAVRHAFDRATGHAASPGTTASGKARDTRRLHTSRK